MADSFSSSDLISLMADFSILARMRASSAALKSFKGCGFKPCSAGVADQGRSPLFREAGRLSLEVGRDRETGLDLAAGVDSDREADFGRAFCTSTWCIIIAEQACASSGGRSKCKLREAPGFFWALIARSLGSRVCAWRCIQETSVALCNGTKRWASGDPEGAWPREKGEECRLDSPNS